MNAVKGRIVIRCAPLVNTRISPSKPKDIAMLISEVNSYLSRAIYLTVWMKLSIHTYEDQRCDTTRANLNPTKWCDPLQPPRTGRKTPQARLSAEDLRRRSPSVPSLSMLFGRHLLMTYWIRVRLEPIHVWHTSYPYLIQFLLHWTSLIMFIIIQQTMFFQLVAR